MAWAKTSMSSVTYIMCITSEEQVTFDVWLHIGLEVQSPRLLYFVKL